MYFFVCFCFYYLAFVDFLHMGNKNSTDEELRKSREDKKILEDNEAVKAKLSTDIASLVKDKIMLEQQIVTQIESEATDSTMPSEEVQSLMNQVDACDKRISTLEGRLKRVTHLCDTTRDAIDQQEEDKFIANTKRQLEVVTGRIKNPQQTGADLARIAGLSLRVTNHQKEVATAGNVLQDSSPVVVSGSAKRVTPADKIKADRTKEMYEIYKLKSVPAPPSHKFRQERKRDEPISDSAKPVVQKPQRNKTASEATAESAAFMFKIMRMSDA